MISGEGDNAYVLTAAQKEKLDSGAVDHRGDQISRPTNTGDWTSSFFIIGTEVAERFAYYGIASNLITYITGPLGKTTATAAANVNVWSATASMLPLLGGFVADRWLGRYRTIVAASVVYLVGLSTLTLSEVVPHSLSPRCTTNSPESTACNPTTASARSVQVFFFFAIYTVALAQGLHKPCSQAFAADQFDENDTKEQKSKSSLFNWWYCAMCVGTLSAQVIVNYVQENISWGLGFGITTIAMFIAFTIFLLGTKTYRYYPVIDETSSGKTIHTLTVDQNGAVETGENVVLPISYPAADNSMSVGASEASFLKKQYEKKSSLKTGIPKLFPVWATCLVYAVIFSQTTTLFTKQGSTMDGRIGVNFKIPAAALQIFISFTIILVIPIYDWVFVPLARKFTGIQSGITPLQRIGIGQLLSIITMVVAALVEMKRLQTARYFGLVDLPHITIPMSLWWLVPQYMIFGITDVFTIIGMQEFFYDQAPNGMRSFGVALYLSVLGTGSLISSILIIIIDQVSSKNGEDGWFSTNLNRAHIDYFYGLLAVLGALELLLFLCFATRYRYKKKGSNYEQEFHNEFKIALLGTGKN